MLEFKENTKRLSGDSLRNKIWSKNKLVAFNLVSRNANNLCLIDPSLKKDKDIVMAAVKNDGWALRYIFGAPLTFDIDILRAAVESNPIAIMRVPSSMLHKLK